MSAGPAESGAVPEETFDATVFAELRAYGNEFLVELVDQFLQESDALLAELRDALGSEDAVAVGRLAHKLRGSCAQMGGLRAAAACSRLEDAALGRRPTEPATELESVASSYDELRGALTAQLVDA